MTVIELITDGIIFQSRGEARRAIAQGALRINGVLVKPENTEMEVGDLCSTCLVPKMVKRGHKIFVLENFKVVSSHPFEIPERFKEMAEDMGKLLNKNPLPDEYVN